MIEGIVTYIDNSCRDSNTSKLTTIREGIITDTSYSSTRRDSNTGETATAIKSTIADNVNTSRDSNTSKFIATIE